MNLLLKAAQICKPIKIVDQWLPKRLQASKRLRAEAQGVAMMCSYELYEKCSVRKINK